MKALIFSILLLTSGEAAQADQPAEKKALDGCYKRMYRLFDEVRLYGWTYELTNLVTISKNTCEREKKKYEKQNGKYTIPKEEPNE